MAQIKSGALMQIEAAALLMLKAPQVLIGLSPAQPALLSFDMITLGIGNLGAPVVSTAIAGYSNSLLISP